MQQDYYALLGVSRNSSADEIKKAYRKLAMQHHPDRNQGNPEAEKKFKELTAAYDVLKDENKRAAYDRYGSAAFDGTQGQPGAGFSHDFSDFADIFNGIFQDFGGGPRGSGNKRKTKVRGSDLRYNLSITLEEACSGKKYDIKYKTAVRCESCTGSGSADKNNENMSCLACGGKGVTVSQQGFFMVERTCSTCGGAGVVIKNPCRSCHGQGRIENEKKITVNIPAGVEDGIKIRVAGEGECGVRGGAAGDLYIFINILQHPIFERRKDDLYCTVSIKMTTAALGGAIQVKCLDGSLVKVAVPQGTQFDTQLKVTGKGMPILKSNKFGNMFVRVKVEVPSNLTARQKELLKEFDNEYTNEQSEDEGLFSKVKNFWSEITNDKNDNK